MKLRYSPILHAVSKFLIPPILLFALYVQLHGEFGPGGGFQAGVVFAVVFILYALVMGTDALLAAVPPHIIKFFAAAGLLLYALTGAASFLFGKAFLDYSVFHVDPVTAQHIGIVLIELGVGMTVAFSMLAIYVAFTNEPSFDEAGDE